MHPESDPVATSNGHSLGPNSSLLTSQTSCELVDRAGKGPQPRLTPAAEGLVTRAGPARHNQCHATLRLISLCKTQNPFYFSGSPGPAPIGHGLALTKRVRHHGPQTGRPVVRCILVSTCCTKLVMLLVRATPLPRCPAAPLPRCPAARRFT